MRVEPPGISGAPRGQITELLAAWKAGNLAALSELVEASYDDLRRIAARHFRAQLKHHSLQPTELVHEALRRMIGQDEVLWGRRREFFAYASTVMRRILVDHARAARRRGVRVTLAEPELAQDPDGPDALEILALDAALNELEKDYPFEAKVVQLKFFGMLSIREIGDELGVGHATVERAWQFARAFLSRAIRKPRTMGSDRRPSDP